MKLVVGQVRAIYGHTVESIATGKSSPVGTVEWYCLGTKLRQANGMLAYLNLCSCTILSKMNQHLRLFFWFAKRQNYQWFKKLNKSKYDLGAGKRVVAKDGKL